MPTNRLTQRRIDTLKPRRKTSDIRDSEIKGFGVRILPSGRKRYFLHRASCKTAGTNGFLPCRG